MDADGGNFHTRTICAWACKSFELLQLIMKYCLFIGLNKSYQINKSICSIRWAGGMFNCVIFSMFLGVDVIIFLLWFSFNFRSLLLVLSENFKLEANGVEGFGKGNGNTCMLT